MQILQQSNINEYIKKVCEQIRWKKAHDMISKEIEGHIIDQRNAFINSGLDDKIATEKAIMEMGDPLLIGTEFDRAYRPKIEWSIVGLTCIMVLTGFLVRYFLIYNVAEPIELSIFNDTMSIIIGFVFMLITYFLDFTAIGKYSKKIFFGLTALLILYIFANKFIFLPKVFSSFMLLMLPTAFAGIIYEMRNKSYLGIIQTGLIFSIPAIISLNVWNISSVIIYSISCLLLLTMAVLNGWFNVKKLNTLLLIYGAVALVSTIFIFFIIVTRPTMLNRIQVTFNPTIDPQAGWITIAVRNILSGAKFFGQGDLGQYLTIPFPSIHSDFLLTYLIHKLGWTSFIIIMTIIVAFIVRLFLLCKKQKSILAKLVSSSILITFIMQVILYVAYNLGFLLLSPLSLPFISYGGTSTLINMILIGIMLTVFNTGDLYHDDKSKYKLSMNRLFEYSDGKIIINLNVK